MSTDEKKLPELLGMMGECMGHIAEIDEELDRIRWRVWSHRAIALFCLSGAVAAFVGMLGYLRDGEPAMAGVLAGLAGLNVWCFASGLWPLEKAVHGIYTVRRKWGIEADRLAGIIGPLVLELAEADGNEKNTTICTIIRPTDGVN